MPLHSKSLLIIFVKHPVSGQVKTRLAKDVGNEVALRVYEALLNYTESIIRNLPFSTQIYYGNLMPEEADIWQIRGYTDRRLQSGQDLGEKMKHAFEVGFSEGYKRIVLIGSDCPEITSIIVENAFDMLDHYPVVLGPATDGGYYLIGLTQVLPFLFEGKSWSTARVFQQTVIDLASYRFSFGELPLLSDIDIKSDLIECSNDVFRNLVLFEE